MADRRGTPLAFQLTGANRHDATALEALIDAIPPIKHPAGPRKQRPAKLHADKAYDIPRCRRFLRERRIGDRIARKGVEAGWAGTGGSSSGPWPG